MNFQIYTYFLSVFRVTANFIFEKIQIFKNKTSESLENEQSLLESYLANPQINFKDLLAMCVDLLLGGIDTVSCKL